jgi:hypothetical protein
VERGDVQGRTCCRLPERSEPPTVLWPSATGCSIALWPAAAHCVRELALCWVLDVRVLMVSVCAVCVHELKKFQILCLLVCITTFCVYAPKENKVFF